MIASNGVVRLLRFLMCVALASRLLFGQASARNAQRSTSAAAERKLAQLRDSPPELYAFLYRMPKGGDLHNHLSGAVYAESFIQDAAKNSLCIEERTLSIARPAGSPQSHCAAGETSAARALEDNQLFGGLIDSLSMRDFVPGSEPAHFHLDGRKHDLQMRKVRDCSVAC
jgi:adenosine deaminase